MSLLRGLLGSTTKVDAVSAFAALGIHCNDHRHDFRCE